MAKMLPLLLTSALLMTGCDQLKPSLVSNQPSPEPSPMAPIEPVAKPTQLSASVATRIETNVTIKEATPLPATPSPQSTPTLLPSPTPRPTPTPRIIYRSSSSSVAVTPEPTPTPSISVSSVSIDPPVSTELIKGDTLGLRAQVLFSDNSTSQAVTWSVNRLDLAGIDQQGLMTTTSSGPIDIFATSVEDPSKRASLHVTVKEPVIRFKGTITYLLNDDVYIMRGSNANPQRLTFTGDDHTKNTPRLSWDGTQVIYTSYANEIYIVQTTGPSQPVKQNINAFTDPRAHEPAFFAQFWYNGEMLYHNLSGETLFSYAFTGQPLPWNTRQGVGSGVGGVSPQRVLVYQQNDHVKLHQYLFQGVSLFKDFGPGAQPRLAMNPSPDLIVYWRAEGIWTVSFTGEQKIITDNTPKTDLDVQPVLSPDQSQIVFRGKRSGQYDLFMVNRDASGLVNLTNTPTQDESLPDWSR
jgi:hypothetical protein